MTAASPAEGFLEGGSQPRGHPAGPAWVIGRPGKQAPLAPGDDPDPSRAGSTCS
jgi:hypothetical protein